MNDVEARVGSLETLVGFTRADVDKLQTELDGLIGSFAAIEKSFAEIRDALVVTDRRDIALRVLPMLLALRGDEASAKSASIEAFAIADAFLAAESASAPAPALEPAPKPKRKTKPTRGKRP